MANRIIDSVVLIHSNIYKANDTYVSDKDDAEYRLKLLDKDNIKKRRRKIKKHKGLLDKGQMTEEQIEQSFEGWKAHAEKGNNYNTIKNMEKFYRKTMMG